MLTGIHHVTALAGDARANLEFYTGVLGMRLVKRTVNYDDPGTYHFYFGDREGRPGSLITFFPWGHARKPRKGSGQAVAVAFAVAAEAMEGWSRRLRAASVEVRRDDERISFEDPDGLALELVATNGASDKIERICGATLCERDMARAAATLVGVLGLRRVSESGNRSRFALPDGGILDVEEHADAEPGTMGRGIVHHIALRVADDDAQAVWRSRLIDAGLRVSPVKDRTYFHSIYFRPKGSTLFEIATDGPGFTIDEPAGTLGEALSLPKWLEPHRAEIAGRLPSLEGVVTA